MKRILLSLGLLLALVVSALPLNAAHAQEPTPVLDANFVAPTNGSNATPTIPFSSVAQTFTALSTGLLADVSIDASTAPLTGFLAVEIRGVTNGVPNDTVLAQAILTDTDLGVMNGTPPLDYIIHLYPRVFVEAGNQYAVQAYFTQYNGGTNPTLTWSGTTGNLYAGGSAFTASGDPLSAWVAAPNGLDLHFKTYVIVGMPISDLSITRVSGPTKAHACQVFKETYRVTNLGPDSATRVQVGAGGGDQFSAVSVDGVPAGEAHYFNLAPGESRKIVVYFKVVAFVPGESRDAFIGASVSSDIYPDIAIDPNPANDNAGTSIWLVGKPKLTCP